MDPSFKSPIIDVNDEDEEDKNGDCTAKKIVDRKNGAQSQFSVVVQDGSSSERRYPDRVRRPSGERWKIQIIKQGEDEHTNVAFFG